MKRNNFIRIAGLGGAGAITGCEGLNQLDTSAAGEGTGVQFGGLIKILATYKATPRQSSVASQRASRTYVNTALAPAYQDRKTQVQTSVQQQISKVETSHASKVQKAEKAYSASKSEAAKSNLETVIANRNVAVAEAQKTAAQRIDALNAGWYEATKRATQSSYSGNISVPTVSGVDFASVQKEANALVASAAAHVPKYLAVSVPEKGIAEEARNDDSVMMWDTKKLDVASQDVYVIDNAPPVGQQAKIGRVSAEYIGGGG